MISLLSGKPCIDSQGLIILVGGVGYGVHVGTRILSQVNLQQDLTLYIYTHVREEALELYGFQTAQERDLFLLLLSVSGIGPKTALQIADYGSGAITDAIQQANVSFFTKIPRVGKKMAQKIIIDLKSKLGSLKELKIGGLSEHEQTIADAVVALGFDEQAVFEVLEKVSLTELSTEAGIKELLKQLK